MNTQRRCHEVRRVLASGFGAIGLTTGVLFLSVASAGADRPADKVTICHRTASHSNPYVKISVSVDAVDGDGGNDHGQGDHYLEHLGPIGPVDSGEWGDIIPPIAGIHGGLNWTTAGQAIHANGCDLVTEVTTTTVATTVPEETTTTTAVVTTTVPEEETTTTTTAEVTTTVPEPTTDKVTICHRTASHSNPYVKISVSVDAVDGDGGNDHGQGDHYLEHLGPIGPVDSGEWGDIIPPIAGIHGGLNWTVAGQAIHANGCDLVTEVTTTTVATTVPEETTTTTAVVTTTVPEEETTTTTTAEVTTTTAAATTTTAAPTTTAGAVLGVSVNRPVPVQARAVPSAAKVASVAVTGRSSTIEAFAGMVLLVLGAVSLGAGARGRKR